MKTLKSPASPHNQYGTKYDALYSQFAWQVPENFNIAQVCCTRWARQTPHAVAIREHTAGLSGRNRKSAKTYTYAQLQHAANALSAQLRQAGVERGDRVAIVLPQRFETAVAYMAVLQIGAVAVPLSMLFGPDALEYRINDSDAVLAIADEISEPVLRGLQAHCPKLLTILPVASVSIAYVAVKNIANEEWLQVPTKADEGAILIYTSGTTGPPKGALIPHRALIGNLTGFVCSQNWFGFDGIKNKSSKAVFWSPADWAWTGGLMDALLPTLYFGREIVAYRGRFSPEAAYELMQTHVVTHTFLFPTALKAMMKDYPQPKKHFKLKLQAIMSAGEAVGDAVYDYCQKQLGVTVNEMFGQTEINYIVGNCAIKYPSKPNSMGKPYPGHRVAVIDDEGNECPDGVPGDVAVNRFDIHGVPDPIFFLGYWKNEAATQAKFTGDWCRTGDLATRDADGYLWYQGRADDVFKAAGYRIGPSEIENCLVKHPAVANAAVVPKPDAERGAVVKAYVVLAVGYAEMYAINNIATQAINTPSTGQKSMNISKKTEKDLIAELQAHVKSLLAPYEYPKEIEFIDTLPMTTTGKVQRRVLRLQEEERAKSLKNL
ncbi:MAG: AMP-binding protein [Polaromonas sp.]|nr:AMP-binding protein [Polaromonas sp.]